MVLKREKGHCSEGGREQGYAHTVPSMWKEKGGPWHRERKGHAQTACEKEVNTDSAMGNGRNGGHKGREGKATQNCRLTWDPDG